MMHRPIAPRLEPIREYYFSHKLAEIAAMNRTGAPVINLGIGSPDGPPHPAVIAALAGAASRPDVHAYQGYRGVPALRQAASEWYATWYGVDLNPETELLPLMGSKEGILHLCMTFLGAGDQALIPNPGYPTYRSAVLLAGAEPVEYPLNGAGGWMPDLEALEGQDLSRVRMMWVNYPHMPTGALPSPELFGKLVAFGRRHNILICHDNPYSFILNKAPRSILSVPGAMDTAVELNSLSKSHNMAGWRVGFLAGAAGHINEVLRFKSNMDSGMFLPLQLAAAEALRLGADWYDGLNTTYAARKKVGMKILEDLGCPAEEGQSGMFLWARVPETHGDGYALSDRLLQGARVFITPGGIFGSEGKQYIRLSLCSTETVLQAAGQKIREEMA